jgi:GAF domain-containing protein
VNTGEGSAAEEFARLAMALHAEPSIEETVDMVLNFALKATDADHASIVFVQGDRLETEAATDPVAARMDAIQAEHGEGPDLSALRDVVSVTVSDTRQDRRWPIWAKLMASEGILSVLSVRMYTSDSVVGTLNMYARRADAFDLDDQGVTHILGRHAALALAVAQEKSNLWQAVDARKRIGQAQGILMERFDLDPERAFAVLVRYSQDNNIKLRKVADTLVETRRLPEQ